MSSGKLAVVILAAGRGTRLRSRQAKVLHRAGGLPLVEHVVRATLPLGAPVFAVVGYQAEAVASLVEPLGVRPVVQQPQQGTGDALRAARGVLGGFEEVLVVPGDAPLVQTDTLAALVQARRVADASGSVLTAVLERPEGYGSIVRGPDDSVVAIVEAAAGPPGPREVNSGMYCFRLAELWPCLEELRPENPHREFYLTDVVEGLVRRGGRVVAVAAAAEEILGCNTRAELAEADRLLRRRKLAELMEAGVSVYLPDTVLVDPAVEVGPDTILEPAVQLLGSTRVGAGCTIATGCVLVDTVVEDGAVIRPHSVLVASRIGAGAVVGPMAHLRDGAVLEPGARVGNFVEVKNSRLGSAARALHLSYLGDAAIGAGTNIGAGTITCNYDGVRKNRTDIGERVFVGSGTELVAPVRVGDGAYIAAGSTITEDVPADALAIARARQVNKPGWARRRRAEQAAAAEPAAPPAAPRQRKAAAPRRRG